MTKRTITAKQAHKNSLLTATAAVEEISKLLAAQAANKGPVWRDAAAVDDAAAALVDTLMAMLPSSHPAKVEFNDGSEDEGYAMLADMLAGGR